MHLLKMVTLMKRDSTNCSVNLIHSSVISFYLEDFTYHRQFIGDNAVVLEFSAHVGALSVKGVDIIQFNTKGQITDFEVMVRPANGLQALAAAMAQQLASTDDR